MGYTPAEIKAMSMYEFTCIHSGWMIANGNAKEPAENLDNLSLEAFEKLVDLHDEHDASKTRELSMNEVLAANKDKVRPA